jgi:hypothetical protein
MNQIRNRMKTKAQELGITEFPYSEYDSDGNRTYFEDRSGYWCKSEYDSNGKETYHEDSGGWWYKREYDSDGNRTYYEDSDGEVEGTPRKEHNTMKTKAQELGITEFPYIEYVLHRNGTYCETSDGYWYKSEYDDNGNCTYREDSYGDKEHNTMKTKAQELGITEFPYIEYDANGKETYYEDSTGFWVKREYDSYENRTYYENSNGFWVKCEYDSYENRTYYENSNGFWVKREYDSYENRTYYENSDGVKAGTPRKEMNTTMSDARQLELRKDKERLDWLLAKYNDYRFGYDKLDRADIDEAMNVEI